MDLDRFGWTLSVMVLLALTVWAYSPLRAAGWVHEDRRLDPDVISLSTISFVPRVWTVLSLRLQAGDPASAFHRVNVAIHLLNGLLLSALLPMTITGLVALTLFLLHPINSEAVSYIAARADLWLGTAILLLLLAQRIREPLARYGVTLLGLAGAVAAKETGVMALGLITLWCVWRHRSIAIAFVVLVGGYGAWMAAHYLSQLASWTPQAPPVWRFLAMQSAAIWRLFALLMPIGLTVDHNWPVVPTALGLFAFIVIMACVVAAWNSRAAWPRLSFAVLWAFIALVPRLLVPTQVGLTEHHLYLPAMGLWLMPSIERTT